MALTRGDFQKLAQCRIEDAKVLLRRKRWDAAYYLAGYAVECALKACIIRRVMHPDEWFPSPNFSRQCFTHDLDELCKLALLDAEIRTEGAVFRNWGIVKDWSEDRRYDLTRMEREVKDFLQAISHKQHGVLTWLQKHW